MTSPETLQLVHLFLISTDERTLIEEFFLSNDLNIYFLWYIIKLSHGCFMDISSIFYLRKQIDLRLSCFKNKERVLDNLMLEKPRLAATRQSIRLSHAAIVSGLRVTNLSCVTVSLVCAMLTLCFVIKLLLMTSAWSPVTKVVH